MAIVPENTAICCQKKRSLVKFCQATGFLQGKKKLSDSVSQLSWSFSREKDLYGDYNLEDVQNTKIEGGIVV